MPVVSNTSPILNFAIIGRLDLLRDQFGQVLIPSAELDQGEAAAIALALELGISKILMDERDGRARAKALGPQPVGILGVLLRAKRDGRLDSVKDAMQTLRREAGFFIADDLFAAILTEAGER